MIETDAEKVRAVVLADYQAANGVLGASTREWLRAHLVPPRPIELARKTSGENT